MLPNRKALNHTTLKSKSPKGGWRFDKGFNKCAHVEF